MLNKYIILLFSILFIGIGCSKDSSNDFNETAQFEKDKQLIREYLNRYHIKADSTADGLYYIIDDTIASSNFKKPTTDSKVTVNYVGYFLDNKVFDTGNNIQFPLSSVIKGWQIGIPVMKEGESGRFFIPSRFGYGTQGNSSVPANSVLIFDVELLKVE